MGKPEEKEYPSFYHTYVSKIDTEDILSFLKIQHDQLLDIFRSIPESKANDTYAEGKWSFKELLCHVNDAERIFAYRALRFARGDEKELQGFDQDTYVVESKASANTLSNLLNEFSHLRRSNIALFAAFDKALLSRKGIANAKEVTVNALLYIIAGHAEHHKNVLISKYL